MPVSQRAASSSRASAAVRGELHRPRGVGLVEVLVAVLILAVGLLGITLVQTRSLGNSNSAMGRSMAVVATYSILEAMRVDRANAVAASLPYNQTVAANACPTTSTTLADVQLSAWCMELRSRFGATSSTTGTVSCATTGVCTVTIQFDDSRGGAGLYGSDGAAAGTAEQVVTRATL